MIGLRYLLVLTNKAELIQIEIRMLDDESIAARALQHDSLTTMHENQFVALRDELQFLAFR